MFFLSDGVRSFGPISKEEIVQYFAEGKVLPSDLVWDEPKREWVVLFYHPEFSNYQPKQPALVEGKPKLKEQDHIDTLVTPSQFVPVFDGLAQEDAIGVQWYVKRANGSDGPLSYLNVVRMLQDKQIEEFDQLSNDPVSGFRKVGEISDFSPDKIESLKNAHNLEGIKETRFRRTLKRKPFSQIIIVADKTGAFKVSGLDLSTGGIAFVMKNVKFQEGAEVWVKFGDVIVGNKYDAKAKVVTLRKVKIGVNSGEFARYGLKFIEVTPVGKEFIEKIMVS